MGLKLLAFLVASLALLESTKGNPEKVMKLLGECKDKIKPTEEDMVRMMKQMPPEGKGHKCMMNCIFEGLGLISGGKLNKDGVMGAAKDIFNGDATKVAGVGEIYNLCEAITDADPCEASAKLAGCMIKEGMSRSIELPFKF